MVECDANDASSVRAIEAWTGRSRWRCPCARTAQRDSGGASGAEGRSRRAVQIRLIGQGSAMSKVEEEAFGEALAEALRTDVRTLRQSLACGEFKGEQYGHGDVAGTVRFVQASEEVVLVEISLSGLRPNGRAAVTVAVWLTRASFVRRRVGEADVVASSTSTRTVVRRCRRRFFVWIQVLGHHRTRCRRARDGGRGRRARRGGERLGAKRGRRRQS